MTALKYVFAVIFFGIGVAFVVGTVSEFQSIYGGKAAWVPAMFASEIEIQRTEVAQELSKMKVSDLDALRRPPEQ